MAGTPVEYPQSPLDRIGVAMNDTSGDGGIPISLLFDVPLALMTLVKSSVHRPIGTGERDIGRRSLGIAVGRLLHELAGLESVIR